MYQDNRPFRPTTSVHHKGELPERPSVQQHEITPRVTILYSGMILIALDFFWLYPITRTDIIPIYNLGLLMAAELTFWNWRDPDDN